MNSLIDVFDDVLDDHLHAGGHQASADHERRHLAVEGTLMRLAGLALDPGAQAQHLDAMVQAAEGRLSLAANIPDASQRWAAAKAAVRVVPSRLWPALLHLAAAQDTSALGKRWRLFSSALRRRL